MLNALQDDLLECFPHAGPLMALYFLGVLLAFVFGKKKAKEKDEDKDEEE